MTTENFDDAVIELLHQIMKTSPDETERALRRFRGAPVSSDPAPQPQLDASDGDTWFDNFRSEWREQTHPQ